MVPMDHHGTTIAPMDGKEDVQQVCQAVIDGGADCIISHIGTMRHGVMQCNNYGSIGKMLHMGVSTNMSPRPNHKVLVNTLELALRSGVDAVSVQVNCAHEYENEMLADL